MGERVKKLNINQMADGHIQSKVYGMNEKIKITRDVWHWKSVC